MGVSGSGKSTVGKLLSTELDIPFYEGDDYHSPANIDKMSNGIPLNDEDRRPWLVQINKVVQECVKRSSCVVACSALKRSYRDLLETGIELQSHWIFLEGTFDEILERINQRQGHFMDIGLLQSQFDTLENPETAISINIKLGPTEIVEIIKKKVMEKSEFGLIGLGVMGKSLSRNLARNGFNLSVFNRHVDQKEENVAVDFVQAYEELSAVKPFDKLGEFVSSLAPPRKIMLMVNAGKTIDVVIEQLLPLLAPGDIIIDGGNANYNETNKREEYLRSKDIGFIGSGVSGGELGALNGPSIMPGGSSEAYDKVSKYLNAIAAKDKQGLPCCTYIGPKGSGHFVKMIHNGIEYAEMQLLCEMYGILRAKRIGQDEIANLFESWKTTANSYLLEITIDILRKKEGDSWLLEKIMDKAGNKGTGNWATIATTQLGVPSTLIASSLFARYISFYKEDRVQMSQQFSPISNQQPKVDADQLLGAYTFARIVNHYQGFKIISEASKQYNWNLNLSEIARIWTNGCIIRSDLMQDLVNQLVDSDNLLMFSEIQQQLNSIKPKILEVVSECVLNEIPIPCLSEAINFFNGITTAQSTANLIQAQRDYFGAHTFQRNDDNSDKFYHVEWV